MSQAGEVERIVRSTPWLMDALEAAREVEPADVDVAFFDPENLTRERDQEVERALRERRPETPWDAKNQAAVHLWYPAKFG